MNSIDVESLEMEDVACAIDYPEEYSQAVSELYAILRCGDLMDRRILHLSDKVISFNGAHYTAWHARRQYLVAANNQAALYRELEYVGTMTEMNQKNYQVWHHRRVIAEVLGDITGELPFVDKILMLDAKNYHAWGHRQWAVTTVSFPNLEKRAQNELEFVEKMLESDFRNNCAWNYMWFVKYQLLKLDLTPEYIIKESNFVMKYIKLAIHNESPWNYLRGLFISSGKGRFCQYPQLIDELEAIQESGDHTAHDCPFLLNILVEAYEEEASDKSLRLALDILEQRLPIVDGTRSNYWCRKAKRCEAKLQEITGAVSK